MLEFGVSWESGILVYLWHTTLPGICVSVPSRPSEVTLALHYGLYCLRCYLLIVISFFHSDAGLNSLAFLEQ